MGWALVEPWIAQFHNTDITQREKYAKYIISMGFSIGILLDAECDPAITYIDHLPQLKNGQMI